MEELEPMRKKAAEVINKQDQTLQNLIQASILLRNVAQIESNEAKQRDRLEIFKVVAPLATVVILAGTLFFQVWQGGQDQREKDQERDNTLWSNALDSVSKGESLAAIIKLKYFETATSDHHRDAIHLMHTVMGQSKNLETFKNLFIVEFSPVDRGNLNKILDLNRDLHNQWVDVIREYDPESKISAEVIIKELSYTCTSIALLLHEHEQKKPFDLRNVAVFDCNLQDVDFSDADLTEFASSRISLYRANLLGVKFQKAITGNNSANKRDMFWHDTAWWQANYISQDLLEYLKRAAPYDKGEHYEDIHPENFPCRVSQAEYDQAIKGFKPCNGHDDQCQMQTTPPEDRCLPVGTP